MVQGCLPYCEGLTYSLEIYHLGTIPTPHLREPSSVLILTLVGLTGWASWCRSVPGKEGSRRVKGPACTLDISLYPWAGVGPALCCMYTTVPGFLEREEISEQHALFRVAALFRSRELGAETGLSLGS